MVSDTEMAAMEDIIVHHAGPLGKFVIKKTVADLGEDPASFDDELTERFIDTVIKRSIFDQSKWRSVREEIDSAWNR